MSAPPREAQITSIAFALMLLVSVLLLRSQCADSAAILLNAYQPPSDAGAKAPGH